MKKEQENWKKAFKNEFGIHFKDSPDELKFTITFIEELLKSEREKFKEKRKVGENK